MGWSQGGYSNIVQVRALESIGQEVAAAVGAASMLEPFAQVTSYIFRPIGDAPFSAIVCFVLLVCAYDRFYGILTTDPNNNLDAEQDQILGIIKPQYREDFLKIYNRSYGPGETAITVAERLSRWDGQRYRLDVLNLLKPEYQTPQTFSKTLFAKLLVQNSLEKWFYKTPIWQYASRDDPWVLYRVTEQLDKYQEVIDNTDFVATKQLWYADHRGAFVNAVSEAYDWFNSIVYQFK